MTKKRIFALCALAALSLSLLSGCGSSNGNDAPDITQEIVSQSDGLPQESGGVTETPAPGGEDSQGEGVDLAAFAQSVQENHEFGSLVKADPADPDMGAVLLENYYPGLAELDLEQTEVYLAEISFSGGELALAQARNAEDAAKVKAIFQARLDEKTTDGPGNYPEELEMWKKSAKLVENGNYIMLVNHENSEAIVNEFNALFS